MKAAPASQKPSRTRSFSTWTKRKVRPWCSWEQQAVTSSAILTLLIVSKCKFCIWLEKWCSYLKSGQNKWDIGTGQRQMFLLAQDKTPDDRGGVRLSLCPPKSGSKSDIRVTKHRTISHERLLLPIKTSSSNLGIFWAIRRGGWESIVDLISKLWVD